MTEADIPLRDQIAQTILKGMLDPDQETFSFYNDCEKAADALLAAFDISPRGSLPVNEEPE